MARAQGEGSAHSGRLEALDGWRAISILLVLATHMLPVGPKVIEGNVTSGRMGMALFFTLSGFLITTQLHHRHEVATFFVRRLFRIVPAAYVVAVLAAVLTHATPGQFVVALAFVQNYGGVGGLPSGMPALAHFWSLCVEMHFYLFVGFLVWVTRFRGLAALPLIWLALVLLRAATEPSGSIRTHGRVDEILSGCTLALVYLGRLGARVRLIVARLPFVPLCVLLLLTCHPSTEPIHFLRSFAASALVGHTLLADTMAHRWLASRPLRYVAEVSYALYLFHPLTMHGWLGEGSTRLVVYAKRPLCFALTFAAAHISTFRIEHPMIDVGKRIARRLSLPRPAGAVGARPGDGPA